jgi:molybdate transport system ATP-binding protein
VIPLTLDFSLTQGGFTLEVRAQAEGNVVALVGPSGAGKTTVLDTIAGLRRPDRGEIRVGRRLLYSSAEGVDLPPRQRHVGYVPQDVALFPHLDVRRNILYAANRGGTLPLARVMALLEIEPLVDRAVGGLSGGERQRVAVARALLSGPDILLLDEPFAAVDMELRQRIIPYLRRVRDELGVPMMYVSHDAAEVRALADVAIRLETGRVVGNGRPGAATARNGA